MGKKKPPKPDKDKDTLNVNRELFCRYYTQNGELFGNATQSYAAAYGYELDTLSTEAVRDDEGEVIQESEYDRACAVCATEGGRLLRNPDVQARLTVLLNELLKDEVVDSQLAKLIVQDVEPAAKIAAIREYNKLRGRIIDKTQQVNRLPFGESDLSEVIATLPQERQDHFYGIIRDLIEEAELLRSSGPAEGGSTR